MHGEAEPNRPRDAREEEFHLMLKTGEWLEEIGYERTCIEKAML